MGDDSARKILIVEDDATIAELIRDNLVRWGYGARCAADFEHIDEEFRAFMPDLVLLDISLPYYNGYYWCGAIRRLSSAPIVFLSSHTESMDIVMAMNMGGDDYITKPFSMDVLTAKIGAVLRRSSGAATAGEMRFCGGAECLLGESSVSFETARTELTKNELKLLTVLISHKNEIVTRESLMMALWNSDCFIDDNTLTVNMNRLRKKLDSIGLVGCIQTRKGQGYMLFEEGTV